MPYRYLYGICACIPLCMAARCSVLWDSLSTQVLERGQQGHRGSPALGFEPALAGGQKGKVSWEVNYQWERYRQVKHIGAGVIQLRCRALKGARPRSAALKQ